MVKRPKIQTNEGPPHKSVSIITNVVQRPDSTYPVIIKPYKLDISQFGDKVRDEMKFTLTNVSDLDLEPTLVAWPSELASIKLPKKIEAGKSASGTLTLRKEALDQSFEKSFTIQLNDDQLSRFTIPIKRTVKTPNAGTASGTPSAGK